MRSRITAHFLALLQAQESVLAPEEARLRFIGLPMDRLRLLLERRVAAANVFGIPYYVLKQRGFRKVLDTTFMIGFLITGDSTDEDIERYFRALQRAHRAIDLEPERYKRHFLQELPEQYHHMVDVRAFGIGERLVFEPYTREMFEKTRRWVENLRIFPDAQVVYATYEAAVLV